MQFLMPNRWRRFEMTGPDALDFGHRMFSRNIKGLQPNEIKLSLFLTAEAKVAGMFWVAKSAEGLQLYARDEDALPLVALIEKYHFAEKFKLQFAEEFFCAWEAAPSSKEVGSGQMNAKEFTAYWRGTKFQIMAAQPSLREDNEAWELHRIQNMLPWPGIDYDAESLVFDMGFEELCDPGKGCYIGQEIVERVRTRAGAGPRKLAVLQFNDFPTARSNISNEAGEIIGSLRTVAADRLGDIFGLAYVKSSLSLEQMGKILCGKVSGKAIKAFEI